MSIRTVDLFCGGGGSSWGAQAGGAKIVAGVDAWKTACETYQHNFQKAKVVNALLDERLSQGVIGDVGDVDLLLASPECTNHTCAKGNKPIDEDSKRTALYVLNYARTYKPRWVVIENVVHMRSWHGYQDLLEELRKSYYVNVQTLDSSEFGVPQKRRRLFIVCDREAQPPEILPSRNQRTQTVKSILEPKGTFRANPLFSDRRAAATLERARRGFKALGEGEPFLIVYYGSDGSGGWQPLDRPLRTMTTLDRFGLVEWNKTEPTLRMLQVPELKRAMGFDDGYELVHGTRRNKIKLLGNGVCPPVMEAIVRAVTANKANHVAASELDLVAVA
jgi:DNA (cytosine-5)-methyltransferase 1